MHRAPGGMLASLRGRGFTLLEVMVALVILASTGLVLFGWINTNLSTATRLRESQVRSQLQLEGVAWLSTINPALEPQGQREVSGLQLAWTSTLIEPMRTENTFGDSMIPRWNLGLYRVRASIVRTETGVKAEWEQVLAGWVNARAQALPAGTAPAVGARP